MHTLRRQRAAHAANDTDCWCKPTLVRTPDCIWVCHQDELGEFLQTVPFPVLSNHRGVWMHVAANLLSNQEE